MARGKTQTCDPRQARERLRQAEKFLDVAELTADETDPELEYAGASAAVAVLAGIAASDAACCAALGERSRSDDHRDAGELLRQITPGGEDAAKSFARLLGLKDAVHYGLISVSRPQLKTALRQAQSLVDFAGEVVAR